MCLIKGETKHKIAQKDIVCYKTATKSKYEILTFFQQAPIELGVPIRRAVEESVDNMDLFQELCGEVVHAFQEIALDEHELSDEILIMGQHNKFGHRHDLVLIKCIIPKGTVYYEDYDPEGISCIYGRQYGATEIIPLEIIMHYTHNVKEDE